MRKVRNSPVRCTVDLVTPTRGRLGTREGTLQPSDSTVTPWVTPERYEVPFAVVHRREPNARTGRRAARGPLAKAESAVPLESTLYGTHRFLVKR